MARLNIEHYKRLIAGETDEARRQVLSRLLAEEVAALAVCDLVKQKRHPG